MPFFYLLFNSTKHSYNSLSFYILSCSIKFNYILFNKNIYIYIYIYICIFGNRLAHILAKHAKDIVNSNNFVL